LFGALIGAYQTAAAAYPADQAKASQQPTAPPIAAPQGNNGATFQYNSSRENYQKEPHAVKVILRPNDRYYYIGFAANIVLVVATIFAGIFVCVQAIETRKSAEATQESAKNFAASQRARLSIVFPPENPSVLPFMIVKRDRDDENMRMLNLHIGIANDGETKAFNVRASGYVRWEPIKVGETYGSYDLNIPAIIRDATADNPVRVFMIEKGTDVIAIDIRVWGDINVGKAHLRMGGRITYDDVFGDSHETPFQYLWTVGEFLASPSQWVDESEKST